MEDETCIVKTDYGPLKGHVIVNGDKRCYKFNRIPYAKPPIGPLRFMPPAPVEPWNEVLDCTEVTPVPLCFEFDNVIFGTEDCLYLEITSPNINSDKPLPVMVWVGSYLYSISFDNYLDTVFLNNENVIVVKILFRIGPFGFLSLNEMHAPGNVGLKDIVMGLKWLQKCIGVFGGDKYNVTIFGSYTGGSIVHLLTLSPMATGLFHKAIIQSSCALNSWSLSRNPIQPALNLAKALDIKYEHHSDLIEKLKNVPALDIMNASLELYKKNLDKLGNVYDATFKPSIEIDFEGQESFLSKRPLSLLKMGTFNKVPILIGSNNIEGAALGHMRSDFYNFDIYNDNAGLLVPCFLNIDSDDGKKIGNDLIDFYLGEGENFSEQNKNQFLQIVSDFYFIYYVNQTVRLHYRSGPNYPIYYYIMSYAGEWSGSEQSKYFNDNCQELPYMFLMQFKEELPWKGSKDCIRIRNQVVRMWTNFAKTGNPTPDDDDPLVEIKWDPVESEKRINYLNIGSELTKGINPFKDRMKFWDELHLKHKFLRVLSYCNDLGVGI